MSHPSDPRLRLAARRQLGPVDPLAAAVRLGLAADQMRATVRPGPDYGPDIDAAEFARLVDPQPLATGQFVAGGLPQPAPDPVTPDPAPFDGDEDDRGPQAGEYGADYVDPGTYLTNRLGAEETRRRLSDAAAPTLNWRSRHDVRSLRFGVRSKMSGSVPLQPVLLSTGPALDQGAEGACIGFGCVDAGNVLRLLRRPGLPADELMDAGHARELYRLAQTLDDVPGESYSGTSVLAGMQAGQQSLMWGGYLWCFGTADIAQTLLRRQPVVIGIPWFSGMYSTGPRGVVKVDGDPVGGHCLVIVGMTLTGPNGEPGVHFIWQNSWGTGYGDEGLGYVAHKTLATLLHSQGEAATPTPAAQTPAPGQ